MKTKFIIIAAMLLITISAIGQDKKDSSSKHQSKFSISFNFGFDYCNSISNGDYNTLGWSYSNDWGSAYNCGSITYPTKTEKGTLGTNFSIKLENKLFKHISLTYGIFYQNIGYDVSDLNDTCLMSGVGGIEAISDGNNYAVSNSLQELNFSYQYWGLLIMPKYYFGNNQNSSFYLSAGMKVGFKENISATASFISSDYTEQNGGSNIFYKTYNFDEGDNLISN